MIRDFSPYTFAPVMDYPDDPAKLYLFDFSKGYDPEFISTHRWGIGKYNERRKNMYVAPQYNSKRNIHMGIDIWTESGAPVYSFYEGVIAYKQNNDREGDYGPAIVVRYLIGGTNIFALYGHLAPASLEMVTAGDEVSKGEKIGELGSEEVNGGWAPHLHFQLSLEDPGEADMPGVVAEQDRETALQKYPDPRSVLGPLY